MEVVGEIEAGKQENVFPGQEKLLSHSLDCFPNATMCVFLRKHTVAFHYPIDSHFPLEF